MFLVPDPLFEAQTGHLKNIYIKYNMQDFVSGATLCVIMSEIGEVRKRTGRRSRGRPRVGSNRPVVCQHEFHVPT